MVADPDSECSHVVRADGEERDGRAGSPGDPRPARSGLAPRTGAGGEPAVRGRSRRADGQVDLAGYPEGTRIIVRRERPHPGAQLSLFDLDEGMRHQVFLTDTPYAGGGTAQYLEARHRAHARVEDRIRWGKDTGFGRFPSRHFAINAAWLELSLTALDPLAWTRILLLDGELATAEPKQLRYRILHAAARITRGGRRLRLRIAAAWPWRHDLTNAFARLVALPRPTTRPPSPSLSAHI